MQTRLAKYQLIRELGRGSMGTVYLGHDPFIDRPVAVKVARPEDFQGTFDAAQFSRVFFNEAQAAGMLRHPNIVAIFDAGTDRGAHYMVMEYVHDGRTLADLCRIDRLPPVDRAVRLVYKCALALDYAHRKGVVHRDVKPGNVLVTPDLDVKVSDFGIALIADEVQLPPQPRAGSPLYMSPEQIRGDTVGPASDLFSLGVVLYELLSGRHPFSAENLEAIAHRITGHRPTPVGELRADVPPVLQRVVERLLAKSPGDRYASAMDLAGDLSVAFDFLRPSAARPDLQDRFSALRALDFFDALSDAEVWEILHAGAWQRVPAGESLVSEGEAERTFYVIVDGRAQVTRGGRALAALGPGDCFGEMAVVSGRPRAATVEALDECIVLQFSAGLIERASINCQVHFYRRFLDVLVERLASANERLAGDPSADGVR